MDVVSSVGGGKSWSKVRALGKRFILLHLSRSSPRKVGFKGFSGFLEFRFRSPLCIGHLKL